MIEETPDEGLRMTLQWDEENEMFVMSYLEGTRAIFQVKLAPASFERLTHDMIRTIKNYNLYQAQQFMEKQNGDQKNVDGGSLPDPLLTDQSTPSQPEQPSCDSGCGIQEASPLD